MKRIDIVDFQKPQLTDAQFNKLSEQINNGEHDLTTQIRILVDAFKKQRLDYLVGVPKLAEGLVNPADHKKISDQMDDVLFSIKTQLEGIIKDIENTLNSAK